MTGYGRSDKPSGSKTHVEYSKRVMANDVVQLMYVSFPSSLLLPSPWSTARRPTSEYPLAGFTLALMLISVGTTSVTRNSQ